MTNRTIGLGGILLKVMRHPYASDLTHDDAADYAIEALQLLGAPIVYDNDYHESEIIEHKGYLPKNIVYIEGIRDLSTGQGMREATDTFHSSDNQTELRELTYTIEKDVIFTSIPNGCVEIAYKKIKTGEDGYPLIVDEAKTKLAIEYYILSRYLEPLYDIGKITDRSFNRINQERHFYMAAASNKLKMPSPDKLESIVNSINRLITNNTAHQANFKLAGKKEIIKKSR